MSGRNYGSHYLLLMDPPNDTCRNPQELTDWDWFSSTHLQMQRKYIKTRLIQWSALGVVWLSGPTLVKPPSVPARRSLQSPENLLLRILFKGCSVVWRAAERWHPLSLLTLHHRCSAPTAVPRRMLLTAAAAAVEHRDSCLISHRPHMEVYPLGCHWGEAARSSVSTDTLHLGSRWRAASG